MVIFGAWQTEMFHWIFPFKNDSYLWWSLELNKQKCCFIENSHLKMTIIVIKKDMQKKNRPLCSNTVCNTTKEPDHQQKDVVNEISVFVRCHSTSPKPLPNLSAFDSACISHALMYDCNITVRPLPLNYALENSPFIKVIFRSGRWFHAELKQGA